MDFGDKDGGSDDDNGSEEGDKVGSLIFKTEENLIFDSVLESSGDTSGKYEEVPEHTGLRKTNKLLTNIKDRENGKSIAGMLRLASTVKHNGDRKTLLTQASNKKDFDYLNLRKDLKAKNALLLDRILIENGEGNAQGIFSEVISKFDYNLETREINLVVTSKRLYFFDKDFGITAANKRLVSDLTRLLLVKANPCVFSLDFKKGPPLLL